MNTSSYTVLLYIDELTVCLYTQTGWTALHWAAHEGKVDVIRLLTEAQAQINIQTEVHVMSNDCSVKQEYYIVCIRESGIFLVSFSLSLTSQSILHVISKHCSKTMHG